MKRILAALALVLIAGSAIAGWNIRQNDDGSAVWVNEDGDTAPVADSGLSVGTTDLNTAGTSYVVTHRPGLVKTAYVVAASGYEAQSDAPSITFYILDTTPGQFTPVSPGATLEPSTNANAGANGSQSFDNVANSVAAGGVIAIYSDGGSTGGINKGTFTIVIE